MDCGLRESYPRSTKKDNRKRQKMLSENGNTWNKNVIYILFVGYENNKVMYSLSRLKTIMEECKTGSTKRQMFILMIKTT